MQTEKSGKLENPANEPFQRQTHPPGRILMVDNDPRVGGAGAKALAQQGYEVDFASDGEAGWKKLQTDHYHLLIIENELPGLTGVGLVKKLHTACMPLPVIMTIWTLLRGDPPNTRGS
jgi:DNA-binding NtrC family response regulator